MAKRDEWACMYAEDARTVAAAVVVRVGLMLAGVLTGFWLVGRLVGRLFGG